MNVLLQVLGWLVFGFVLSVFFFYVEEKENVKYQINNDERLKPLKANPMSFHFFIIFVSLFLSVFGIFSPIAVYYLSRDIKV